MTQVYLEGKQIEGGNWPQPVSEKPTKFSEAAYLYL